MKTTKKEIQKVLRSLDRTNIFKIAFLCGINTRNRHEVYDFIKKYSPSQKVTRLAGTLVYGGGKVFYFVSPPKLTVHDSVNFARRQDKDSNYCKIIIKGSTNYYWASPVYRHSDYNKSIAFPITEKNTILAKLLNHLILK